MLDLNLIRRDPDYVKNGLAKRGYDADFTELLKWDEERRAILAENESIKAERNKLNKQIPALRKQGQDAAPLLRIQLCKIPRNARAARRAEAGRKITHAFHLFSQNSP